MANAKNIEMEISDYGLVIIPKEISSRGNTNVDLVMVDTCGYYVVSGKKETMNAISFLGDVSELIDYIMGRMNVRPIVITHDTIVYYAFEPLVAKVEG